MQNRGAWILAVLALGFVAFLMIVMARSLDTKAPIRIDRGTRSEPPVPTETPISPEEADARDQNVLRAIVERRAPSLASVAAAQAFPSDETSRARCTFVSATVVHRETDTVYWRLDYECADVQRPEALPNLTSVSVRAQRDGLRWLLEP